MPDKRIIPTPSADSGELFGAYADASTEPDVVQLTTLAGFRSRKGGPFGVIVIYDVARDAPIAHDRECPFITEDAFVEKVLDGGGHNGRYWVGEEQPDRSRRARRPPLPSSGRQDVEIAPRDARSPL
jgi:hypothetical protein